MKKVLFESAILIFIFMDQNKSLPTRMKYICEPNYRFYSKFMKVFYLLY